MEKVKKNHWYNFFLFSKEAYLLFVLLFHLNFGFCQQRYEPNDEFFDLQWNLEKIMAPEAWHIEQGDEEVLIFVLDGGIEWMHDDLVDRIFNNLGEDADGDGKTFVWSNSTGWTWDPGDINGIDDDGNGYVDDFIGWNFVLNHNNPSICEYGLDHGTKASGIVGATFNSIGTAGVTNNCKIVPLAICTGCSDVDFRMRTRTDGINYAASFIGKTNIKKVIINCSWVGGVNQEFENAIINARNKGAIICFSSGNEGFSQLNLPAGLKEVIACGATDEFDSRYIKVNNQKDLGDPDGSNCGIELDICAPGWYTPIAFHANYTTSINNSYDYFNQTSSAAPQIAGAAALLWSHNENLSAWEVQERLQLSADKTGGYNYNHTESMPGHSLELGYGRLNIFRALLADKYREEIEPNNSKTYADGIICSGMNMKGELTSTSDQDWYYFDVESPCNIAITLFAHSKNWKLYNSNLVYLKTGMVKGGPSNETSYYISSPGRYYLKFQNSVIGKYDFVIKGSGIATKAFYENEPNNNATSCDGLIEINETVNGKISSGTDYDWYIFKAINSGNITFNFNGSNKSWYVYKNTSSNLLTSGSSTKSFYVSADLYYIKVRSSYTGSYDFKITSSTVGLEQKYLESEPNNIYTSADGGLIKNKTTSGKINSANDVDWYFFDVKQSGYTSLAVTSPYKTWYLYEDPYDRPLISGSSTKNIYMHGPSGDDAFKRYFIKFTGYEGYYEFSLSGSNIKKGELLSNESDIITEQDLKLKCYPNPFSKKTQISYCLSTESKVSLKVYDLNGRLVKSLVDKMQPKGEYTIDFYSEELSNGIYLYKLKTEGNSATGKMLINK